MICERMMILGYEQRKKTMKSSQCKYVTHKHTFAQGYVHQHNRMQGTKVDIFYHRHQLIRPQPHHTRDQLQTRPLN